ncbi:MAG: hypothetical protein HJJLKODD_02419 [Phycisphaerae bacterium]|nr:hypothetical protein [Phycisphaerae bacterium]
MVYNEPMEHWLVKSDPDEYSAADLQRDKRTSWTGVKNPQAQQYLRAMKQGDAVLIYHTVGEKAIVALAKVAAAPQPDPSDPAAKRVVVNLRFDTTLKNPVTLSAIKADPAFSEFLLVRNSRLSVMPVAASLWKKILQMAI